MQSSSFLQYVEELVVLLDDVYELFLGYFTVTILVQLLEKLFCLVSVSRLAYNLIHGGQSSEYRNRVYFGNGFCLIYAIEGLAESF